jgi:hypothetical protein
LAAVPRQVLRGRAPALAAHYPSAGGTAGPAAAFAPFRDVVDGQREVLDEAVRLPCQTNEVGRCAPLMVGFLRVSATSGLPLRALEVGASAGLSLRFDRFHYAGGGAAWGDPRSLVDLAGLWAEAPPHAGADVRVAERAGCDPAPLDPAREPDRLALMSSVWADQRPRFQRLAGALELARRDPVAVEKASADDWVARRLATPSPGRATVVFHSVVDEYFEEEVRGRFRASLAEAGARASLGAPLYWLRLEPRTSVREHGVTLTSWPGAEERLLATSGAHGTGVRMA